MLLILGPHFENHCPGNSAQILAVAILSRKPQTTAWQRENTVKKTPPGTYPAKTLDTDIVCVLATRSSVYHSVSKLIIGRVPCHSAEQFAPVLHQNWRGERIQPDFRAWPRCQPSRWIIHHNKTDFYAQHQYFSVLHVVNNFQTLTIFLLTVLRSRFLP